MSMFCFQCQEAAQGTGCTIAGVCGKPSDVANLQDTLLYVLKGISWYNEKLRVQKVNPGKVDKFVFDGLFSTITNANFDKNYFSKRIIKALQLRNELHSRCLVLNVALPKELPAFAAWNASSVEEFEAKAGEVGILSTKDEDIRSLRELIIYGVKGIAAYAEHAYNLGGKKEEIFAFMQRALVATTEDLSVDELVALTLETGKYGVDVMALLDAVKSGAIKKFFVMAGCDGRMKSRDYYTQFAEKMPKDTVILTAGCAKYRYNKLQLGDIGGIPRVLDAGQCNDSYSLAVIALKLKEIFELNDINELPISYNIAWYEQKAVIVLLALLHLGVKNIHLGPTLPAFLSPNVTNVLVENFGIAGITEVEKDLAIFLEGEEV